MKNTASARMRVKTFCLAFILAIIACACAALTSCGSENDKGGRDDGTETNSDVTDKGYVYPEIDGDGADFTFLTPTTTWDFYTDVIRESMTGEVLDDTIYNRNVFIEENFNINFKEIPMDITQIQGQLRKVVQSGDAVYDAAFCPAYWDDKNTMGTLITENTFYNLREIPTLNLGEKWWNQTMLKEAAIGGGDKVYYAGCDINIMALQTVSCVYFNQDMMINLGLDLPYDAVRQGKWTFEMLFKYMKDGARLNGADSFKWDRNGDAVYGMVSYQGASNALLAGSLERLTVTDDDGYPSTAIGGERFFNVMEKIQEMLDLTNGVYLCANDYSNGFHLEPIFRDGRALMMIGELKSADVINEMDATFGIVPVPKYDEIQEGYYCHLMRQTPVVVIPVTNRNPEFAGAVMDAMAYVSNRDVTPVFYDLAVSQKRLRNDDSIDMLEIIRDSGSFDVGCVYGWTSEFYML
ncbi:MAG: hypothetical protein FWD23_17680, partial [Oscillospiraceae bacterium]|nr:hypothetical protein [Oscillospiraceae bacterium]